ncbi:hypothetical protein JCM8208_007333 [Rhodotorula glutinis]
MDSLRSLTRELSRRAQREEDKGGYTAIPMRARESSDEAQAQGQHVALRRAAFLLVIVSLFIFLALSPARPRLSSAALPSSWRNRPPALPRTRVGPRRFPPLYHGRGCNSSELIAAVGRSRIREDGASRFEYVPPPGRGPSEFDLDAFSFSFDVDGCPAPHIFSPAETCDLLSAFGGVYLRGDSLMRQFTQGIFLLLANSFDLMRVPMRKCVGEGIFTQGKACKGYSIFDSAELKTVCGKEDEPFMLYDQFWGFGKEANTSASFLLGKYRDYVDALPERRKLYSPVFVLGVGIHSAWNVQETLDLHLSPFLEHASSSSPRPLAFFSGYPAVPANKPPTYLPRQGADNTQRYNADVRELLGKVSPGEASDGARTMLDWYGMTDGARSFDGTHYAYQVAMERAQIFLNVLDAVWGEVVERGGLVE